jgi:catechol 2,3-dioxygenase-like lactoylglutathione lyase family enzyme
MSAAEVSSATPFFIVRDALASMDFYTSKLGFEITYQQPAENPFFGIVARGGAMIMLKSVGVTPLPNSERSSMARWDAYIHVPDPDSLAAEFTSRHVEFSVPLADNHDGLRGFEVRDADGYVLFFGRPKQ